MSWTERKTWKNKSTNWAIEWSCAFSYGKSRVPGIILPRAILGYYNYFATDAGNDAFELAVAS